MRGYTHDMVIYSKLNFEKKLAENIKKDSKSFFAYVRGRSQATRKVGPLTDNGVS